jgi:hypothetical protein
VKIQANADNGDTIYVIGPGHVDPYNPSSTNTIASGVEIAAGGILDLEDGAAINYYDLNRIYIDAAQSADGVKYLYGRR